MNSKSLLLLKSAPLNVYFDLDNLKPKVAVKRRVYEVLLHLSKKHDHKIALKSFYFLSRDFVAQTILNFMFSEEEKAWK